MVELNKIYQGNALDVLKSWPDGFIDCVVTSPPYWGLRAYGTNPQIWDGEPKCQHIWNDDIVPGEKSGKPGPNVTVGARFAQDGVRRREPTNTCSLCSAWRGELGLEPTFQSYISHLIQIFSEVKRVLKPTGTCWVNISDSYSGSWGDSGNRPGRTGVEGHQREKNSESFLREGHPTDNPPTRKTSAPNKSLCGIPERFALAMTDQLGFVRRNTIIWKKNNCMPSSASDRFTIDFEYVYFFSKQQKYFFNQQFEPHQECSIKARAAKLNQTTDLGASMSAVNVQMGDEPRGTRFIPLQGRNMRTVWQINTHGYKEAHFATFPEKLIEPMIKAGCPKEICEKCGKAREKIYKETGNLIGMGGYGSKTAVHQGVGPTSSLLTKKVKEKVNIGYTDCGCNAGCPRGGVICDPFFGSGTSGVVAKKLGRSWLGIELNEKYIAMAEKRIADTVVQGELL